MVKKKRKNQKTTDQKQNYLLIAVIVLCMVGTVLLIDRFEGDGITGKVTSGTTSFNVLSKTAINFTVDSISFGAGWVDAAVNNCTMDSEGTLDVGCVNFSTVVAGFTIQNIGNSNVSLNLTFGSDADSLIGGDAGINAYQVKVSNGTNAGCNGTIGASVYTDIVAAIPFVACDKLLFGVGKNEIDVDIRLVIPYNAKTGTGLDLVQATATSI